MTLYLGKQLSLDEAKEYNKKERAWRLDYIRKGWSIGCVSTLACEYCGILVSDSICLCSGNFTCPKCGKFNGIDYSKLSTTFSIKIALAEDYSI